MSCMYAFGKQAEKTLTNSRLLHRNVQGCRCLVLLLYARNCKRGPSQKIGIESRNIVIEIDTSPEDIRRNSSWGGDFPDNSRTVVNVQSQCTGDLLDIFSSILTPREGR